VCVARLTSLIALLTDRRRSTGTSSTTRRPSLASCPTQRSVSVRRSSRIGSLTRLQSLDHARARTRAQPAAQAAVDRRARVGPGPRVSNRLPLPSRRLVLTEDTPLTVSLHRRHALLLNAVGRRPRFCSERSPHHRPRRPSLASTPRTPTPSTLSRRKARSRRLRAERRLRGPPRRSLPMSPVGQPLRRTRG
jgi:hypothetical protein